jgi:hypothetical protein
MARLADIDDPGGESGLYAELHRAEEDRHARRGGRLVLVSKHGGEPEVITVPTPTPTPTLAAFRAGRPVELPTWKLPWWARDRVRGKQVRVYPDGRVVDV